MQKPECISTSINSYVEGILRHSGTAPDFCTFSQGHLAEGVAYVLRVVVMMMPSWPETELLGPIIVDLGQLQRR